ncbi:MAG: hypothetical protein Q7T78_17145 [Rhodoferax sp.]|nr:hypothetical protein [Rhodoferax sp.]
MSRFPPIDIEEMVRLAPDLFCSSSIPVSFAVRHAAALAAKTSAAGKASAA